MPDPTSLKEMRKPKARTETSTEAKPKKRANVRPHVAELIKKVIEENAPTWKELAKR